MAIALLASFLTLPDALAKGWEINGIRRSDGTFGFCRAEFLDDKTGLTLAVALSLAQEVNLGIKVPKEVSGGGFKKGESFALTLSVDTLWTKPVTAEAGLPELLLMKLGNDPAFLAALSKGKSFTAKGEADATTFPLRGAAEAVKALQQCVADGSKGATAAAPTLPAGLTALLQEAKVTVKPLALAGGKGAQAVDIAWIATETGVAVDGGFREARVGKGDDFKKLSDGTVSQLKSQCKPGLKVEGGKTEALPGLTLASYDLTCGPELATLLAYRTNAAGGNGIYGVLIHRAALKDKAAATAIRDRLAAVIKRVGAEADAASSSATADVKPADTKRAGTKP